MSYLHEFAKMLTLASIPTLVAAQWLSALSSVTIGAVVLYALLVRVG